MSSLSSSYGPARSDRSAFAEWRRTIDWPLLFAAFILLGIGLVLSLAAGPTAAERIGYDRMHYVIRHALFAAGGAIILITTSVLDKQWARRFAGAIFLGAFILMALSLIHI